VEFLFDFINVPVPTVAVVPGVNFSFTLDLVPDCIDDLFFLIRGVEFSDLT
jgi:hypothetical protein